MKTKEVGRKQNNGFLRFIITCIICAFMLLASFAYSRHVGNQKLMYLQTGLYASDATWLYRLGVISEEEYAPFRYWSASGNDKDIKKLHDSLEAMLDGKEEEYLNRQSELLNQINNELSK